MDGSGSGLGLGWISVWGYYMSFAVLIMWMVDDLFFCRLECGGLIMVIVVVALVVAMELELAAVTSGRFLQCHHQLSSPTFLRQSILRHIYMRDT